MKIIFGKFAAIFTAVLFLISPVLPQTERDKGIELYRQGKTKEAAAVLEKASRSAKTDAEVWNYLGLAYTQNKAHKKAVKAFEKAVAAGAQNATYYTNLAYAYFLSDKPDKAQSASTKAIELNPKGATAYYIRGAANVWKGDNDAAIADADKAIAVNADYAPAYTLKAEALHSAFGNRVGSGSKAIDEVNLLQRAKDALEFCLQNCQNNVQKEIQQQRLETIQVFYAYFSKNRDAKLNGAEAPPALPDPNFVPLKILSKNSPQYTDDARENGISGVIRMAVFFSETGRVTHTLVLKGLGGGLNDAAVKAARQIKFEPAKRDGKPISQVKIVEYSFSFR